MNQKIKSHLPEWPLNLPNKGWKGKVKKLLLLLQQVISSLMEMFILCMVLSHFSSLPWPRKPDHSLAVALCSLSIHFMWDFWKKVSLLCYVVSEKDLAFSIWFCAGCGSATWLMGVTITCITLFWLDSFCFNVVKYVSVVCFLV